MKKHLVLLLAVSSLVFLNTGCTSKKSEADVEVVENADVEKIEVTDNVQATDPSLDVAMQNGTTTETPVETTTTTVTTAEGTEAPPAPEITETPVNTETTVTTTETSELVETPVEQTVTLTDGTPKSGVTDIAPTETATVTQSSSGSELTETPITDSGAVASALTEENVAVSMKKPTKKRRHYAPAVTASSSPKEAAPVAKKASIGGDKRLAEIQPYQTADGGWINTVYFVRPNETFAQISDKIFKADKKEELSAIAENAYLKKREVKDGDKIYYVSPNRPDDSARMMIYQEDVGMVPETYIAKEGENFKTVSKDLLGFESGWKEVWFSNSNASNKKFKEGEVVRYWKTNVPEMAAPVDTAQALPPPPADAAATMPAPPTDAAATTADANAQPPVDPNAPPPADMNAAPPPPPPPPTEDVAAAKQKVNLEEEAAAEEEGEFDSNTMMSMGALGVLVAALAYLIIRKKRQKEAANNEINA